MPQRARYTGTPAQLHDAIGAYLSEPSYLAAATKLSGSYVARHRALVVAMQAQQPNLSYTKKVIEDMHRIVFDAKNSEWGLDGKERRSWIQTMAARLRAMLRFTQQARLKAKPPQWLLDLGLPAHEVEDEGETEDKDEAHNKDDFKNEDQGKDEGKDKDDVKNEGQSDLKTKRRATHKKTTDFKPKQHDEAKHIKYDSWIFGWDSELLMAWRHKATEPNAPKEFVKPMPSSTTKTDPPRAVFQDGMEHTVVDITNGDLADLGVRAGAKKSSQQDLIGFTSAGESVKVGPKADRHQLMCVLLDGRQVCQIRADLFASEEKANAFMRDLALALVAGEITKAELYEKRNAKMKTEGIKSQIRKRPAAAAATSGEASSAKKKPASSREPCNEVELECKGEECQITDENEHDCEIECCSEPTDFEPPCAGPLEAAFARTVST